MAVRRTEYAAQGLKVDIDKPDDGSGAVVVIGRLIVTDGDALDQRLDAMARAVCDNDPRTLDQRRSAALGALGHGADRLACGCGDPGCAAAERQPSAVVVHVIASEDSLTDDTPAQLDGTVELPPADKPLREMTIAEALDRMPAPPPAPAASAPAMLLGAMLPARCWPPKSRAPPNSCGCATPATLRLSRATSPRRCWPPSCAVAT
ncbi:DUF222 domain-containing protein [Mycolicibacterium moriokaense]|uniref:DUF222 domain-containing protein n=1 Tax=Mycolicibacterium moriokaense TaxID=39691 RepID=UPI003898F834